MKKGVYFCWSNSWDRVYGKSERQAIAELIEIPDVLVTPHNWREHLDLLADAELIIGTWGAPVLDEEFLEAMPKLKAYFYGAGDMSRLMTASAWDRGIRITTSVSANAIPVAEFALSQILFSLKRGWEYMALAKQNTPNLWGRNKKLPGIYQSKVGLVSIGQISRKLCQLLGNFDLTVLASCQTTKPEEARELGIELVDVETVFRTCDVVSIHLRSNGVNQGFVNRRLLDLMKPQSTLINTSRGAVINQQDLVEFLKDRPDVYACIDVTDPEPPPSESELLVLPNVVLTPHLAGSMDRESRRLGHFMIAELRRYLNNQPLQGEVTREMLALTV